MAKGEGAGIVMLVARKRKERENSSLKRLNHFAKMVKGFTKAGKNWEKMFQLRSGRLHLMCFSHPFPTFLTPHACNASYPNLKIPTDLAHLTPLNA